MIIGRGPTTCLLNLWLSAWTDPVEKSSLGLGWITCTNHGDFAQLGTAARLNIVHFILFILNVVNKEYNWDKNKNNDDSLILSATIKAQSFYEIKELGF